jgi:hypothetical protein
MQDLEVVAIFLAFLSYGLLGGYILKFWRRRRNRQLVRIHVDSMAWRSYWLPFVIFAEIWSFLGAAALGALAVYSFAIHGALDSYRLLGVVLGLAFFFVLRAFRNPGK